MGSTGITEEPGAISQSQKVHNFTGAAAVNASSDYEQKTEMIYGQENVTKWALQRLDTAKKR